VDARRTPRVILEDDHGGCLQRALARPLAGRFCQGEQKTHERERRIDPAVAASENWQDDIGEAHIHQVVS